MGSGETSRHSGNASYYLKRGMGVKVCQGYHQYTQEEHRSVSVAIISRAIREEQKESLWFSAWLSSVRKTFASAFILPSLQEERLSASQDLMSNALECCYGHKGNLTNLMPVESHLFQTERKYGLSSRRSNIQTVAEEYKSPLTALGGWHGSGPLSYLMAFHCTP